MDMTWTMIGTAAAVFTSTSFIPQLVLRLRQPQHAKMSYGTLVTFIIGAGLWTAYGIHLHDAIIIGANIFVLATLISIAVIQLMQERISKG